MLMGGAAEVGVGFGVVLRCSEGSLLGCAILQTAHKLDTKCLEASIILYGMNYEDCLGVWLQQRRRS